MPTTSGLTALTRDVEQSGYYPALVLDVLDIAIADEPVFDHLVHVETTFVVGEIQRHVTVLVVTATRLIVAHVDDHPADDKRARASAAATTEAVPLRSIQSVAVTYGVESPEKHHSGGAPADATVAVSWGSVSRIDIEPADCGDPQCSAEHGLTGTIASDDIVIRVSGQAEGSAAVRAAVRFAKALSAATASAAGARQAP